MLNVSSILNRKGLTLLRIALILSFGVTTLQPVVVAARPITDVFESGFREHFTTASANWATIDGLWKFEHGKLHGVGTQNASFSRV